VGKSKKKEGKEKKENWIGLCKGGGVGGGGGGGGFSCISYMTWNGMRFREMTGKQIDLWQFYCHTPAISRKNKFETSANLISKP